MTPLLYYIIFSALLFSVGLAGALTRRNAILVLIGIELMLNAANLNFIAFWRYSANANELTGVMFVIFSIGHHRSDVRDLFHWHRVCRSRRRPRHRHRDLS